MVFFHKTHNLNLNIKNVRVFIEGQSNNWSNLKIAKVIKIKVWETYHRPKEAEEMWMQSVMWYPRCIVEEKKYIKENLVKPE